MCSPKLEAVELLDNLIISSRDMGLSTSYFTVTLFGDGVMGVTFVVL